MKLYELKEKLDLLLDNFNKANKYVSIRDMLPYKKSLCIIYSSLYLGEPLVLLTDSYGTYGYIILSNDYNESVEEYVNSLEPSNEEEKQEWIDTTNVIRLMDI
jgi:hypothetical protein